MYNEFYNQQILPGLYLNEAQYQNFFSELNRLNNVVCKEKEARKIAEKKLQFYENGRVDTSESIREISDKCTLTVLHKGLETEIANWYIEKCCTILFNITENCVMVFLNLSIMTQRGKFTVMIKETDLKGTKIIDIFENKGYPIMQVGPKARRAVQFIRYIKSKVQSGNITNIPFINGWQEGKYICSYSENAMFKEIFEVENPYTRKYFANLTYNIDKSYEIFRNVVETFGNEDTNLAFSIAIWGMLYSEFAKHGHQQENMLAIENKKNMVIYERLMTQWVNRRAFDASQQKKYFEIVQESKDEVTFLRTDVCTDYKITNVLGSLLPMVQRHEIVDIKTNEVKKVNSLFIIETNDWRILDKVLKLPFNMEKDIRINVDSKDISALYRSICQWIEKNYELINKWMNENGLENELSQYPDTYFCLKISHRCLCNYFYCKHILSENSFSKYIKKWLNGNTESNHHQVGQKIIDEIIKMKNAGEIRFLSRRSYDYTDKEVTVFLVDDNWIYISTENIIDIATKALGEISKTSIKNILLEDGISDMEAGHFGTEVIVGKEKRKTRMIRIKREIILSETELMYYMEV